MNVLDKHGNYGVVVRLTPGEYDALKRIADGVTEEEE